MPRRAGVPDPSGHNCPDTKLVDVGVGDGRIIYVTAEVKQKVPTFSGKGNLQNLKL